MEMKIKDEEIRASLKRIKQDELFKSSPRYAELLEYLVEKSIKQESRKEITIGLEFFSKHYDGNDSGTGGVRVYMFNLRKRLAEYYESRGTNDRVIFELNKGSYNISFKRSSNYQKRVSRSLLVMVAAIIIICTLATLYIRREESYCWRHFFNSPNKITLVLADHLTVRGTIDGESVTIHHPKITNRTELLTYINEHHCDTLKINAFSLFTNAIPHAVSDLTRWFTPHDLRFNIISESELKYTETQKSNIIYVGQSKIMSISKDIFLSSSEIFSVDSNDIYITKSGKTTVYKPKFLNGSSIIEYAIVSYMPLQDGCEALYFVSNNDVGTMATVRRFTNAETLREFYDHIPKGAKYFNALFKVSGLERNEVNSELIEIEILK